MSPFAGRGTARGIFKTKSGLGMPQPSAQCCGRGTSLDSPAGDFASAQAASVPTSAAVSEGSFEKLPHFRIDEPRGHGFFLSRTPNRRGDGRVSWYDSNGIGAMPPVWLTTLAVLLQDRQYIAIKSRWDLLVRGSGKRSAKPVQ